ncbi:MAG: ATP-binding protein, partial [Blastocatellia bacterium]
MGVYHMRLAEIAPHDPNVVTNISISVIVNAVLLTATIARFSFASRGPMRALFGRLSIFLIVLFSVQTVTTYVEQSQPALSDYSDRLWIIPYLTAASLTIRWRPAPFEKRQTRSRIGTRRTRLLIFNIGLAVMVLGSAILGLNIYGESRLVGLAAIGVAMVSFAARCALMQSAQERLVEALGESNERFKFVALATNDVLWDRNMEDDSVAWNDSIHTVFGYPPDVVGCHGWWADRVHPGDRERVISGVEAALDRGDQSWRDEYQFEKADGSYVYVMDRGYVIRDAWGKPLRMVGTMVDLTLRREIEAQLERAREAAEAIARRKSEFLANMSHEIRTPMNAVIGMTTILLDTPLSHEQQDCVETIRTAGDTLLTVINDILDFSKIESGKLEPEQHPLSVQNCIEEAFDLVSSKAAGKGLDVAYLIDDQVPSAIVGDITRLRQILVNLLNNAIKFTSEGEVVASVSSRQLDDTRVELEFAIRDTGIGIPEDRIDRLFQSFSQIDASTTREYGGTGLGLAISSRLAEMMGGKMWVES